MRLGGRIFEKTGDPEQWARAVKAEGYSAAGCPVSVTADDQTIGDWLAAAARHDIVIAEVGAFGKDNNPLHPDADRSRIAIRNCQEKLALAERLGARCCVNIAGSRNPDQWDGPHPENLTDETFDLIVHTTRQIIDAVNPTRTFYTLETMPWVPPDSADSYLRLIRAIDRKAFAVHLDPVNIINCPSRYYRTGDVIRECFAKLGPWIRCCHAKDILLTGKLTVHLEEVPPGAGGLDFGAYLRELDRLDPDMPLIMEHMKTAEEYRAAAIHLRGVAQANGAVVR